MNHPQRTQAGHQNTTGDLLEELLDRPLGERHKALDKALTDRVPKIEELLPDFMKGQGERLCKRAMMTFQRNPDLQKVPPADFVRCVLEAAEMGFAIDGKMCYVVNYKGKYQCQLDYKGLVAVARRMKTIVDIYGDVVCKNDRFKHGRHNGECILDHTYELGAERGDVIGAYAVVILPNGHWRHEVMDRQSLDKIQARAPAKNGPWSSDPNEMRKKTVFRRALKLYGDDPGLIRVLELTDEGEDEVIDVPTPAASVAELGDRFRSARPPQRQAAPPPEPEYLDETPAGSTSDRPETTTEPDPLFLDEARAAASTIDSEASCKTFEADYLGRAQADAERTVIEGLALEARKRIKNAKAKQGTLAGT